MEKIVPASELLNEKCKLPAVNTIGGYGITYIGAHFDDILCPDCANQWDAEGIIENVQGGFTHWEGASLYCDSCNCEIESEYGEPEENEDDAEDIDAIQSELAKERQKHIRKEAPWILGDC